IRAAWSTWPENREVRIRWWRHRNRPQAVVIAIHGWSMGDQRINSLAFMPGALYQKNIDVAIIELPFHGRRRPAKVPKSRSLFPCADLAQTNEGILQTIS